ncbi:outer membrane protein [Thalassotalea maritima]|uniref:outer membrane protein n=1 Tax=Thalassotalea maritima TaxID=3242416 RepID=UPI00352941FC
MFKKTMLAVLLAGTSFASSANWVAGAGYMSFSDSEDGIDINLNAVIGSVGYKYLINDNFSIVPELRLGFGLGDDTFTFYEYDYVVDAEGDIVAGEPINSFIVKTELERFFALSLRAEYDLKNGVYLFAVPSYANAKFKASASFMDESFSASEDSWEFGLGAGAGYKFTDTVAAELSYEQYDGTDILNANIKFSF